MRDGLNTLGLLAFLNPEEGGGGDAPSGTKEININQNGTTTQDVESYKNAKIIASVPNSYSASDEGKVVSDGELVAQDSDTVTQNGTYDTTLIDELTVAVPGSSPTGTKQISISQNGTTTEDVSAYASAQIAVSVPNSYAAGDEGKVVSNGTLVSQTSDTVTQNGTVDTTLISSLLVNVSGGGGSGTLSGTFTVAENTLSVTIADLIGTNLNHIIVKAAGYINNGLVADLRTMLFAYLDYSTSSSVNIGSNSAGTGIATVNTASTLSSSSRAFLDRSTGVFTMLDQSNGGGYMAAGVTYEWFAW